MVVEGSERLDRMTLAEPDSSSMSLLTPSTTSTTSASSSPATVASSKAASKLGFSIDSIVGCSKTHETARDLTRTKESSSPPSVAAFSIAAARAAAAVAAARSSSPSSNRSPSPPLLRPIPTSAQSYLDQIASLKAFYDQRGPPDNSPPTGASGPGSSGVGLQPPGALMGLPRPGLPPPVFLGAAGAMAHPQIPREYPLYPWFISRHRFPGGPHLPEFLLPFRKPKRIRTAFSPSQLLKLEQAFEKNQYVVGAERKELAKHLNLSETQVKVWFQNRRTKHKREQQEQEQSSQIQHQAGKSSRGSSSDPSGPGAGSHPFHHPFQMDPSLASYEEDEEMSDNEEIDCDS
eukprot:TRINITY_DN4178_c0_g2_i1.p1 TRINITY_DN4178_c0_g2~~TRINITY_DN4178_c0_g2_i1.p1  ORF type:complete len:347 (-),score=78.47 TRINITY_DN4178_c0_g2_i1:454-1494(-)